MSVIMARYRLQQLSRDRELLVDILSQLLHSSCCRPRNWAYCVRAFTRSSLAFLIGHSVHATPWSDFRPAFLQLLQCWGFILLAETWPCWLHLRQPALSTLHSAIRWSNAEATPVRVILVVNVRGCFSIKPGTPPLRNVYASD